MSQIELIVRGDDFGVCHAVNEGIVQAFSEGILTMASVMVPCPWFPEAASLALEHHLPTGVHATFTCEWPHFRWRPLTSGPSLVGKDGTFWTTLEDARANVKVDEAKAELAAQVERYVAAGLQPDYVDTHMGTVCQEAYQEVSRPYNRARTNFKIVKELSTRPAEEKVPWLLEFLTSLPPGLNMLITHPSVRSPEVASLAPKESWVHQWGEELRASDLDTLLNPQVREAINHRGIKLVSNRDLPQEAS